MQRHSRLALLLVLVSCKAPPPAATTTAPALPSFVAPEASAPPAKFALVLADKANVRLFPVGSRALVERGTTFWGYAQPGAKYVVDAHAGDGLPTSGASRIQAAGGAWPDVAVVSGEKDLAEYAGPSSVIFFERQGTFVRSKAAFDDVPRLATISKGVTYLFVPEGTHFIAGLDTSRCGKAALEELPVLAIRGDQKLARPRAAPSFFAQAIESGLVVGGDMCRPGAFVASLDVSPLRLEMVPGSDACTERTNVEGMPFTHARLFPSASGGIFVLLANQTGGAGACATPPRVLERSATGAWSLARTLPMNASAIDPAGTAWAITDHHTVMRIPAAGASTEIALDPSCSADIREVLVPFPDQPWITVKYDDDRIGLCVAYL